MHLHHSFQCSPGLSHLELWLRSHQGNQTSRGGDEGETFLGSLVLSFEIMMITGCLILLPLQCGLLNYLAGMQSPMPFLSFPDRMLIYEVHCCASGQSIWAVLLYLLRRMACPSSKGWTILRDKELSRYGGAQNRDPRSVAKMRDII